MSREAWITIMVVSPLAVLLIAYIGCLIANRKRYSKHMSGGNDYDDMDGTG